MARLDKERAGGITVLAFLDMLASSEMGAALLAATDDGYNVIVGSTAARPHLFQSYADHPQVFVSLKINGKPVRSSAAGRYQFLARTWDALARDLRLSDFTPENQDLGAIELVRECGALTLVRAGRIEEAITRCNPIWASLPGAGYDQHENRMDDLLNAYHRALQTYIPDFSNVIAGVDSTAPGAGE